MLSNTTEFDDFSKKGLFNDGSKSMIKEFMKVYKKLGMNSKYLCKMISR